MVAFLILFVFYDYFFLHCLSTPMSFLVSTQAVISFFLNWESNNKSPFFWGEQSSQRRKESKCIIG